MSQVKTLPFKEAFKALKLPQANQNLFCSFDWLNVLHETYGLQIHIKYIEEKGEVLSYIVYSVIKNFLEWKICVCSYCDYCDCYVQSVGHWDLFFKSFHQEYPKYRIAVRNLRDETVRQSPHFKLLSKEYYHRIDVREDLSALWNKLFSTFKRACRKAEKERIVVKKCGKKELIKFYNLHLQLRKKKYRIFPQPYCFFETIWEQYMEKGKGYLLGAYDSVGRFVAAHVYLVCGNTLYYKFGTSLLTSLESRPNNLLMWHGIKLAKELHLEYIDLGSSGYTQEGLVSFKSHICKTTAKMEIQHFGYTPPDYKYSRKIILGLWTKFFTLPWMPSFMVRFGSNVIYPYLA